MTDRPVIFSEAMVRALLAGTKTQTRRLATSPLRRCEVGDRLWVREAWRSGKAWDKNPPSAIYSVRVWHEADRDNCDQHGRLRPSIHMPRWASRLTLIVEGVRVEPLQAISEADAVAEGCKAAPFPGPWWQGYRDDGDGYLMHQEAIGETPPDWMIRPEPMKPTPWLDRSAVDGFRALWSSLHDKPGETWNANPAVLVLTFRVERGNIDQVVGGMMGGRERSGISQAVLIEGGFHA